jgi:endonuclease/exonuclease/phosphatase family metal-dependent hydrolase
LVGTRGKAFRQAVLVDVPWNDRVIHVVMVHVDSGRDRERQLETVIRLFQSLKSPAILMGDLNTRPDDPRLAALLSEDGVENVLSKLGDKTPTDNIDWIITRGLECVDAAYHHSGASDHPVVKATLR